MTRSDLDRLRTDLAQQPSLREDFDAVPQDSESLHRWATERGYQVSRDEVALLIDDSLSDDDLEMVAGGWDNTGGGGGGGTGGGTP